MSDMTSLLNKPSNINKKQTKIMNQKRRLIAKENKAVNR